MPTYKVGEVTLSTEKAIADWEENRIWDGNNNVSRTADKHEYERLYKSAQGHYWIETSSRWAGKVSSAKIMTEGEACTWLLINQHDLPEELLVTAEEINRTPSHKMEIKKHTDAIK